VKTRLSPKLQWGSGCKVRKAALGAKRSEWPLTAHCVEKLRFWLWSTTFFAERADELLVARGSAKLAFRRSRASSLRLTNDFT
jgi:hypothetical protein